MCQWGTWTEVLVKVPAGQSSTGREKWKLAKIDSCIADLVSALQSAGIEMRGSCCGHGRYIGCIQLLDGRLLLTMTETDGLAL